MARIKRIKSSVNIFSWEYERFEFRIWIGIYVHAQQIGGLFFGNRYNHVLCALSNECADGVLSFVLFHANSRLRKGKRKRANEFHYHAMHLHKTHSYNL